MPRERTSIVGFDSAWMNNPKKPGAICAIRLGPAAPTSLSAPELVSFEQALPFIEHERAGSDLCLVAIDQPTIVPNLSGTRPVDRVAGSLISWLGGGVQPASRSKIGMFDDFASIWRLKEALGAAENPEHARVAASGLFLIEVFPAIALPTFQPNCFGPKLGPRYNPARRKTFKLDDWRSVVAAVIATADSNGLIEIVAWAEQLKVLHKPQKHHQDKLDSVICALVGHQWLARPRPESVMIGDLQAGFMITPASPEVRAKLAIEAARRGVPFEGFLSSRTAPGV